MNYEARMAKLRIIWKQRPELRKVVLLQVRALKTAKALSEANGRFEREVIEEIF